MGNLRVYLGESDITLIIHAEDFYVAQTTNIDRSSKCQLAIDLNCNVFSMIVKRILLLLVLLQLLSIWEYLLHKNTKNFENFILCLLSNLRCFGFFSVLELIITLKNLFFSSIYQKSRNMFIFYYIVSFAPNCHFELVLRRFVVLGLFIYTTLCSWFLLLIRDYNFKFTALV